MKKSKLIYGVGVNNAEYRTQIKEFIGYDENGKQLHSLIWTCPYYIVWKNMMRRCYSEKEKENSPWYSACTTVSDWHYFMTFRAWMIEQDWEGKQLDKDLLFPGNKVYGPNTCVFLERRVNSFLIERGNKRGEWPIGVYLNSRTNRYGAYCSDVLTSKQRHLGYFDDPQQAHQAWLTFKLEQAKILASQQSDARVAAALIDRYENYHKYFGENK